LFFFGGGGGIKVRRRLGTRAGPVYCDAVRRVVGKNNNNKIIIYR